MCQGEGKLTVGDGMSDGRYKGGMISRCREEKEQRKSLKG